MKFLTACIIPFFIAGCSFLNTAPPSGDTIKLQNNAYAICKNQNETLSSDCRKCHLEQVVVFAHKKHIEDYNIGCGECHHDEKGTPLTQLKPGDDVKRCIECHRKEIETAKEELTATLPPKKNQLYHAEAFHENCKGCHRIKDAEKKQDTANSKEGKKNCTQCHPPK